MKTRNLLATGSVLALVVASSLQTPVAKDQLSLDQLRTMVENMGMEPQKGEGGFTIKLEEGGYDLPTWVSLSESKQKVWMTINLTEVEKVDRQPVSWFKEILKASNEAGPAHFYLGEKWMSLGLAIDNRGLTPTILRQEMNFLAKQTMSHKAIWELP
jgi:hypothetical protein